MTALALAALFIAAPVRAGVLLTDDFQDGDSSGWQTFYSGWTETDGVYKDRSTAANTPVSSVWAAGYSWSNYEVEADVKKIGGWANGGFGIMFRFNADYPSGDYCFCMLSWQTGGIRLACPEGGVDERVSFSFAGDTWYRLRATADGDAITCGVVGAPESFAVASNPTIPASGTVGFRATHQWADFDNIVVTEILDAPVFSCAGFEAPLSAGPVTVRGNRALPLRACLIDPDDYEVADSGLASPPVVQVFFTAQGGTDPIDVTDDVLPAGHSSEGNQFFFDSDGFWNFNLRTTNYSAAGTYTIYMETGDANEYGIDPTCETSFVRE